MNTILSLILAGLFVITCSKSLRKNPVPYYVIAAILSIIVFICQKTGVSLRFPVFIRSYIWPVFYRGGLAGALFILVMWAGALPRKSKLQKILIPVRGELSIIASILTLGHNAANGRTYFKYLFLNPSRLPVPTLLAACCSILMICIMLPLFITSFNCIRRKMKASNWKKLQRLAYLFYFLLFCHLMLLYIPHILAGRNYYLTVILYCLIFIGYAVCRIRKWKFSATVKAPDYSLMDE